MSILSEIKVKPWLTDQSQAEDFALDNSGWDSRNGGYIGEDDGDPSPKVRKIGLFIFLAVVSSLVLILVNAYLIRMGLEDWKAHPKPPLLWVNTAFLIVSSLAFQWTVVAARNTLPDRVRIGLGVSGTFAWAFIIGQLWVWQQLTTLGYYAAGNPSNSFFYLLTALHGIHLLGGLVVWAKTVFKFMGGAKVTELRTSIEMCAIYWHFLLIVWLMFFGLMLFN